MSDRLRSSSSASIALWILAVLAALFFLKFAKSLLIPIALAALISYALEPVVAWLERRRVHRTAGAALVMLLILGAATWGAYALRDDARELVEALPKAVERAREAVRTQLGSGIDIDQAEAGSVGTSGGEGWPGGSLLQRGVGAMFELSGQVVVVFFLVLFLLVSGNHVKRRVVEIAGPDPRRKHVVDTIIGDINAQIQRYLLVLLVTGGIVAAATWAVLAWMGVQHAPMWAILAGVFNSIPYFGPVIVSGGLFVVGLAQGGGASQGLQMAGAAIVITSLEGWLLTPALMGKAERMSALVVFLGLLLWTWVWGGWGTILAVPMLVIIKSVADHVDQLRPVGRLMAP